MQALDAGRVELIGAMVAGAVNGLDGLACLDKAKPSDVTEGLELFAGWIGRGKFIAGYVSHNVRGLTVQVIA